MLNRKFLFACAAAGFPTAVFAAPTYTITDLGTLGGSTSIAYGLNNLGDVVGQADLSGNNGAHAFLYNGGPGLTNLGTLGGSISTAYGINDLGEIVGDSRVAGDVYYHAFSSTGGPTPTDLGTLPGGNYSRAYSVNNSGQIVGFSYLGAGTNDDVTSHAFLSTGGPMIDLGTLPGSSFSTAQAIISPTVAGQVGLIVGDSSVSGNQHGFLSTNGGPPSDIGQFDATSLSSTGVVGGFNAGQALLYYGGTIHYLGNLLGQNTEAEGVNSSMQVVGNANTVEDVSTAFYYDSSTGIVPLITLLQPGSSFVTLNTANAINDEGQIVGDGINALGQDHAYLLTPVPEPVGAASLFLAALLLVRTRRAVFA